MIKLKFYLQYRYYKHKIEILKWIVIVKTIVPNCITVCHWLNLMLSGKTNMEMDTEMDAESDQESDQEMDLNKLTIRKVYEIELNHHMNTIQYDSIKNMYEYGYNCLDLSVTNYSFYDIYNISNVPDCITELNIKFSDGVELQGIDNLPLSLKILKLQNFKNNICFDLLPPGLEVLFIHTQNYAKQFNKPLDNLPSNLKILYIESEDFNQPLLNLPKTLETLCIFSNQNIYNKNTLELPSNLKYFNCNCINYSEEMVVLPDSLEFLYLHDENKNNFVFRNKLPDSLRQFGVGYNIILDYDKLPKQLDTLIYIRELHVFNKHMELRINMYENNKPLIVNRSGIKLINYNFKIINFDKCCCSEW